MRASCKVIFLEDVLTMLQDQTDPNQCLLFSAILSVLAGSLASMYSHLLHHAADELPCSTCTTFLIGDPSDPLGSSGFMSIGYHGETTEQCSY